MRLMCGILGGNIQKWDYEKGMASLIHRGPDEQKVEKYHNFTFVFCRLSIRDLSKAAMQPMSNDEENVHVIYNGEIYGSEKLVSS